MRIKVIAASLTLLAFNFAAAEAAPTPGEDAAQPAASAPPVGPPRVFQEAGYAQHEITPGLCQVIGPKEAQCEIPAMTAGRYFIVATGTSTATGDGAVQAIQIRLDGAGMQQPCASAQSQTPKDGKPWTSGQRTISVGCVVQLISDNRVMVKALYADQHATTSDKGPGLFFQKLAWNPVWTATAVPVQLQAAKPPAK